MIKVVFGLGFTVSSKLLIVILLYVIQHQLVIELLHVCMTFTLSLSLYLFLYLRHNKAISTILYYIVIVFYCNHDYYLLISL